jgi:VWFA-related protein
VPFPLLVPLGPFPPLGPAAPDPPVVPAFPARDSSKIIDMGSSFRTISTGVAILALLGVTGDAQTQQPAAGQQPQAQGQPPPPADPQQPVFRTGINFVRVDVIVTDKNGNQVADLKQSDFEVAEDGKPQAIETFKLVKLDGGVSSAINEPPREIRTDYDEESEASREDVRLFAIFLDDYHVRRGASMSVRNPLTRFVESQLGPSDMVGVMYPLESTASVRMTRNHSAVVRGLEQFQGRKYDYTPRNQFEERYAYYPTEIVERIRNQVSLSALKALIVHMGSLKEGRKALIVVSEGYSNALPPQMRNANAQFPGSGNPNAFNPGAGANDPNEDRYQFFQSVDLHSDLREVFDTANRNNVSIYAVDPRGLPGFEFDIDERVGSLQVDSQYLNATMNTLRELAENTDGRAIVNRNDLDVGMKQITRDSSAYYLIGYNSSQAPSDGKFHEIKVRVKRPGIQVRARKGYWALTAAETARAAAPSKPSTPKPVEDALAAVNRPARASVVRTWVGTARGENGKTRVMFVWEPAPKTPGESAAPRDGEVSRVSLMAVGPDGSPYFRGRVPDVTFAAASGGAAASTGTAATAAPRGPSRVVFDVPPGKMQLRVSVEGSGSQVLDSEVREITVPDLTSAQTVFGTPQVFRARTAREYQQIKSDPDAVPIATREFTRMDRLLIRIPAYGPGGSPPPLRVHILNRAGQPMNELTATPAAAAGQQQIDLPIAGLAPGEYVVEISAGGDGGDAKELLGFRVVG